MTDRATKNWATVCELTDSAMYALADVQQALMAVDSGSLTPLEFRTLLWVRCSLASLYGVRADETVTNEVALLDALGGDWMSSLSND